MTRGSTEVVMGGRYRLLEPIARGGMGTVWRADDETLGRTVAVKVLNEGLSEDARFIERFRREARAAAGLTHPNVAGVYDYGEDGSTPYIVMEFVEGETLADRLRRGPLPAAEAAAVGAAVAEALAEAHERGIVHRDVKPANVMLPSRGSVKVMDFGIASSSMAANLTATGMVMGTARYLSPEQAAGERATPASDVYSLGVVLYEMLAGTPPFDRDTPVATAMAHVREDPRPLRDVVPHVPEELASVVDACLRKDPAERPSSAAALAYALRGTAGAPPVAAAASASADPTLAIDREGTDVLPATAAGPARLRRRSVLAWLVPLIFALLGLAALFLVTRLVDGGGGADELREAPVTVPNLTGMPRGEAARAARHVGLTVTFRTVESHEVPKDRVISQTPQPDQVVPAGTRIVVTLSSGPPLTVVPSMDGVTSADDVTERLRAANLELEGFVIVEGEAGIVRTDPPEGAEVPEGTRVTVYVGQNDGDRDEGGGNGGNGGKGRGGGGNDGEKDD